MEKYPRIHLAIDNCFAIKRWIEPKEWMKLVKDLGDIRLIQASTDNEIDPSHNTEEFREYWIAEVKKYEEELDLELVSLYSGYATYRTVGIASQMKSKRRAMIERYFKPVVDIAQKLGAQVGNTLSAFSENALQDPTLYETVNRHIEDSLIHMTGYAGQKGVPFSYEQMYTPTQGMWTIEGCMESMRSVYQATGYPMYVTIDTAHQAGQGLFMKPSLEEIMEMQRVGHTDPFRLPATVEELVLCGQDPKKIIEILETYEYWFASPSDRDVFEWFSALGCYSPLVHLQQTDGTYSAHRPFIDVYNERGIIKPEAILKAIARSYESEEKELMPPKVKDIYLTFEIFFGITDSPKKIIRDLKESIAYWRKSIPRDGLMLNELI